MEPSEKDLAALGLPQSFGGAKRKLLDASNPPTRKYRGNRHISRIYYNGEAPDAELNHCDGVADESDCTLVAETEAEPEVPVSFFPTKQSSYPYFHLKYPRSLKQYLEEFRAWCGPESSSNQGYDENSFDRFETVMKAHRLQHVLNKRAHADAHMEGDFVPDCEYKDSDSDSDSASSADESEREDEVAHLSRAVKSMSDVPRNLTSEDIELAASFHISKENVVAVGRYLPPVVLDLHDGDINSVPEHDAYVARVLSGAEAPKNQRMRFDDDDEDVVLSSTSSHLIPTLLSAAETVIHAPAKPIDDDLPVMPTLPAIDPTKVEQFLQSFEDDGDDEVDVQGAEEDECPTEYENESGSEVDQVEEDAHADNEEFMGESENSDAEFEDDDEELIGEYCSDPDHDNAPKEENNGPRINSHVTFSDSDSEVPVAIQSVPSSIKPAVESSGAPLASMGISDDDSSDDSDEDATFRARVRAATNPNNDTIQFPAMPALKFPAFPTALTKVSIADPVAALKSQESSISSEIKFNDDEDEEEESEEMRRVRLEIESKRSEIIERFSTGQTNAGKECLQVVIKSGADEVDLEYDQSFQEKMEKKYWGQRLKIFSLFDHGCLMDAVGWYSTTVERIARHEAERCSCGTIVDAFCGSGGNAIQFAFTCERVIAIEINPRRLALARHNARIYGVADRIEFICGDYMQLAPTLKADVVFLAPPWGGINYNQAAMYDLDWLQPTGSELFEVTSQITPNIAMSLPRNVNTSQVIALPPLGSACQIEKNVLGGHTKSVTAYFGNLVSQ